MPESDAARKRKRGIKSSSQTVQSDSVAPAAAVPAKSSNGPLSAVAARKLALARQQTEQEEAIAVISGSVNEQAIPLEEEASEDDIAEPSSSDEEEDLANQPFTSKEFSLVANGSTSTKRYFDSIPSSPPASSIDSKRHPEVVDQEDAYSQHDRSMAEDDTEPETSSAAAMRAANKQARASTRGSGGSSKRRKRGSENYRGSVWLCFWFVLVSFTDIQSRCFDPSCISSWRPARGTNWILSSDSTQRGKRVMIGMQPGEVSYDSTLLY